MDEKNLTPDGAVDEIKDAAEAAAEEAKAE